MIILQMSGGLGNQMFQYALYTKLIDLGKDVKIDDTTCYQKSTNRSHQILNFPVVYKRATKADIIQMTDSSMNIFRRIKRKIKGRKDLSYREDDFIYNEEILSMDQVYLEGCYQNQLYFKTVKDLLLKDFRFPLYKIPSHCSEYLDKITNSNSISIHIRRGDYLEEKIVGLYGDICTNTYYREAIKFFQRKYDNCMFYIFTNDHVWAKEQIKGNNFILVQGNSEEEGYWDMFLMSKCKHNIIANSSFSWWGSWLNQNPDKIIMAPVKWMNGRNTQGIYTEDMTVGKC